jgi:AcrR family transcriptional regulator
VAGRPAEDVETLRRRIVDASIPRLIAEGPSAYSLNRLCAELGIAKKTFYRAFSDFDALVCAVVENTTRAYTDAATRALATARSPIERVRALMAAVFSVAAERASGPYLSDLERDHPRLWRRLAESRRQLVEALFSGLEEAQREGEVRADLDLRGMASLAEVLVERVLDPVELHARGLDPAATAALLVRLLFDGVKANDGGRRHAQRSSKTPPSSVFE